MANYRDLFYREPYPPMGPVYSYPVYPTYSSNTYYYS